MSQYTLTFSEQNKGWTSFWSYRPDALARLNDRFYTIKNGQLWLHNDADNPIRNNFYGVQYNSSIKTVFNDAMADDKVFKTLILEANQKWAATFKTNLTESTIAAPEFNTRESRQFSFIRKNEAAGSLRGNAAQGIGVVVSVTGFAVAFNRIPDLVSVGDQLYQINVEAQELIGLITDIDRATRTITVDAFVTVPVVGYYAYAKKNSRVEGEETRGYYLEVTLTNNDTEEGNLFAVSTETSKSYV